MDYDKEYGPRNAPQQWAELRGQGSYSDADNAMMKSMAGPVGAGVRYMVPRGGNPLRAYIEEQMRRAAGNYDPTRRGPDAMTDAEAFAMRRGLQMRNDGEAMQNRMLLEPLEGAPY